MTKAKRAYIRPEDRESRQVKGRSMIKIVRYSGTSGAVFVPPAWIGKYVRVTLLTEGQVSRHTAETVQAVVDAIE